MKGGDHRAGTERPAPVEADSGALQANTGKTEHHGPAVIEQRERFADAHPSAEALQDCTPKPEAKYPLENSASANGLSRVSANKQWETRPPRQVGFTPIQQEQMVLSYVQQHGQIKRAEVMGLCRISTDQAARLLKKLKDRGAIIQSGKNRGATYTIGTSI